MFKCENFLEKVGDLRIHKLKQIEVLDTKRFLNFVKLSLILRKICKYLTAERISLQLKVGEFTCMSIEKNAGTGNLNHVGISIQHSTINKLA